MPEGKLKRANKMIKIILLALAIAFLTVCYGSVPDSNAGSSLTDILSSSSLTDSISGIILWR
ncbi:MAG: hypothetical protein NC217_01405 [Muribaculaceae bacterium]|nr:hypothetical protein [Muribaculaceae bacterium]